MESNAGSKTQPKDARKRTAIRVAIPLPLTKPRNGAPKTATAAPEALETAPVKAADSEPSKATTTDTHPTNGLENLSTGAEQRQEQDQKDTSKEAQELATVNGTSSKSVSLKEIDTVPQTNGEAAGTRALKELADTTKKPTQIRTELPPAFVPSSTPQTAGSSTQSHTSQTFVPNQTSFSRPNSTHITFSTDESGTPSPIPHLHNAPFAGARHSPHASVFHPPYHHPSDSFHGNGFVSPPARGANGHFPRHQTRDSYASNDFTSFNDNSFRNDFQGPPGYPPRHPIDDPISLRQHISSLYASENFADVRLHFSYEQKQTEATLTGHRLILARSPTLMRAVQSDMQPLATVKIDLPGKWMDERAMQEAIWFLYGGNLVAEAAHDPANSIPGDTSNARLRYVLAYLVAGQFLELPAIAQRGVDVAAAMLSWDALPTALEFTLDATSQRDRPVGDPSAASLQHAIIHFFVTRFPHDFQLDNAAVDLDELGRLPSAPSSTTIKGRPVTHRASRSTNDPRLTRLRFGDIGGTTSAMSLISSILFSLPYQLLAAIVEHPLLISRLGFDHLTSMSRDIVAERESRRLRLLKAFEAQSSENENLRYEEHLSSDNGFVKLSRRYNA